MFGGSFDKAFKNHHVISDTDETLVANPLISTKITLEHCVQL
jgi:hypothetical protein